MKVCQEYKGDIKYLPFRRDGCFGDWKVSPRRKNLMTEEEEDTSVRVVEVFLK